MAVKPEDFFSETPPPRIIGTECEYKLQTENSLYYGSFVDPSAMAQRNIPNHGGPKGAFMGHQYGSGRVYVDVGHLEFATAEAMGPASAAVEDIASITRMVDIIDSAGQEHKGLFRTAGTFIPGTNLSGYTNGFHENYLIPTELTASNPFFSDLVPSALAARMWLGGGTLREDHFVLSQKIWGNGGIAIERTLQRRTQEGGKPMLLLSAAQDVLGTSGWTRAEVRCGDPGFSLVTSYLNFAIVSLTLRVVEHSNYFRSQKLGAVCMDNPVEAAKAYAGDIGMRQKALNKEGKSLNVLDLQEEFLALFHKLDEYIELPNDERLAINALQDTVSVLRKHSEEERLYSSEAAKRTNFAARYRFVGKGIPPESVTAANTHTMYRNLIWDRVLPDGGGMRYWQKMTPTDSLSHIVEELSDKAGLAPRAVVRAGIVDSGSDCSVVDWSSYMTNSKPYSRALRSLGSPYGDD